MLGAISRSVSKMHAKARVGENLFDRVRKRLIVSGGYEQARLAILDERLQATDARADDRSTAGHRFQRDQTERLGERRHGANVRSRVVEREISLIQRADEVYVRLHAVLVYEPAQLLDLLGLGCVVLRVERTT